MHYPRRHHYFHENMIQREREEEREWYNNINYAYITAYGYVIFASSFT